MSSGYDALRDSAALLNLSPRARILARGRDRARLLHNLSTNEVKKMTSGSGAYAFLLSPQGRIQSDLTLFCFADHFLIDTEPELRERVPAHIRRYVIADQVELEDVSDSLSSLGIEGPDSQSMLESLGAPIPATPYAHADWNGAAIAAAAVTGQPGFRIYAAADRLREITQTLTAAGAVAATPEEIRTVRIENGRPRFGEEIGEKSLPQETQQMHAVSFNKGCYLGQEIVERIRAQGHVNKKLMRIELATAQPPTPNTKLKSGDADAGEILSAVYSPRAHKSVAIAMIRTQFAVSGTALQADSSEATVI
jgi:folate-binding protein YgfZ